MSQVVFESASLVIIATTLVLMVREHGRQRIAHYGLLVVAGWIGEQTCVSLYSHYAYDSRWSFFVGSIPVFVPLIWPLVILSARDIAARVWREPTTRAVGVGLIVCADASMVEVIAVRAGLWQWAEPGHLGVPLIGILGWGLFAGSASALLDSRPRSLRLSLLVLAPLATHLMLLAAWWGGLRWVARGELGQSSLVAVAILGVAAAWWAVHQRRRGVVVPMSVAGPRMLAALLFFALLATVAPDDSGLWIHTASVALPYIVLTQYREARHLQVEVGR